MELVSPYKKRKIAVSTLKYVTQIIEMHSTGEKWLVEWSDKTRTWETYDIVKDLHIFQDFLQCFCKGTKVSKVLNGKISREIPSYIA